MLTMYIECVRAMKVKANVQFTKAQYIKSKHKNNC